MEQFDNQFSWVEGFPPVYGHTSISYLKRCPNFSKAKDGDMGAAMGIIGRCIKQGLMYEIRERYPDATTLPIMTDNRLPEALAMATGLKVHRMIRQVKTVERKTLTAMERLIHTPIFSGRIDEGTNYIIVDDIVTQGGTISSLRKYVEARGGRVIASMALAYSISSQDIVPRDEDISKLVTKFSYMRLSEALKRYNVAEDLGELTNSQVKYLLRFSEFNKIYKKLECASYSLFLKGYVDNAEKIKQPSCNPRLPVSGCPQIS